MEKRGVVEPGRTRDTEARPGEKQAVAGNQKQRTESLDDDFTKRAADAAAGRLNKPGS